MTITDHDRVRDETAAAIRDAMKEIGDKLPTEALFGFALCTDDDVMTLYHVFACRSWVAAQEKDYPEIGYIAVEWQQTSTEARFDTVNKMLRAWSNADSSIAAIEARFAALRAGMKSCRDARLFDRATLLSVSSTDPGDAMVRLALDAARALNEKDVADRYAAVMG